MFPSFGKVAACFFLSGFAALIHQVVWFRYFSVSFGASEMALGSLLGAYMGGLAAGAWAASKLIKKVTRPLLTFAILELGAGITAFAVPWVLKLCRSAWLAVQGGQAEPVSASGLGLAFFCLGSGFIALIFPTMFMGATLPVLAKGAVFEEKEIGPRIGILYGMNTFGGVVGTLLSAFVLLPAMGLTKSLLFGSCINFLVCIIAIQMAKRTEEFDQVGEENESLAPEQGRLDGVARWILPIMLVSGAISFVYEILWTRLLSHVLGITTFAFAVMLAAFLSGIALGGWLGGKVALRRDEAVKQFWLVQMLAGTMSWLAYHLVGASTDLRSWLVAEGISAMGVMPWISLIILLPSSLFIGMTFPLAVRILAGDVKDAGKVTGRVYAWNTVGAIIGATAGAWLLMPWIGYEGTVKWMVVGNLILGACALFCLIDLPRSEMLKRAWVFVIPLIVFHPKPHESVLRSSLIVKPDQIEEMIYYRVGRSSTVTLWERRTIVNVRIDGLPQAGITSKGLPARMDRTTPWLGFLPAIAGKDVKDMLVIGFGGGVALEFIPKFVESVDVYELEDEVLQANRSVSERRLRDPFSDERINVYRNDARTGLALCEKRYQGIISQPGHPWAGGSSHLYTKDFFELVKLRLDDGGVYVQWMDVSLANEQMMKNLAATLADVFPNVRLYRPYAEMMLFVASEKEVEPEVDLIGNPEGFERYRTEVELAGVRSPMFLLRALLMDDQALREFASGGEVVTDNDNRFSFDAPYLQADAIEKDETRKQLEEWDVFKTERGRNILQMLDSIQAGRLIDAMMISEEKDRARSILDSFNSSGGQQMAHAVNASANGNLQLMAEASKVVFDAIPDNWEAGFYYRLAQLSQAGIGNPDLAITHAEGLFADGDDPRIRALLIGSLFSRAGRFKALEELEQLLSDVPGESVHYPSALNLRIKWRLQKGISKAGMEAVKLCDLLLATRADTRIAIMRLEAAVLSEDVQLIDMSLRLVSMLVYPNSFHTANFESPGARERLGMVLAQIRNHDRLKDLESSIDRLFPYFGKN